MRVCLVAHGFPPHELAGVENFTAQLARGLAAAGNVVEVFVPRRRPDLANLSVRREERDGYGVHWLTVNSGPSDPAEALEPPGHAEQFEAFLDRVQPDVVHFQHVFRVGAGLIEVAAERGLPIVYTGHDYFPVCHRITLLRPDLTRCDTIGEPERCARCDLTLGLLNECEELGDYHMGAFASDLPAATAARVAATLAGDRDGSGLHANEWTAAEERRTGLDRRRSELFGAVDRFLCPTRFLAERLVAGGVRRESLQHLPYGIDTAVLADVPRPAPEEFGRRPLRFGFVGSLTKHKGVHVLLEAFERVAGRAELVVHGDSTDRSYVEAMRRRAEAVGARLPGAFHQEQLPSILAELDVLVVPSIWVENYPIAIREAFAAGRVVIASDVGAFPESVRDGVDGLTFAAGDVEALAECLERCVNDPQLVARLRDGIGPVDQLGQHVSDHVAVYRELVDAARARREAERETVLPHLRDIAADHAALSDLPSEELLTRALGGLDALAETLGRPAGGVVERLSRALGPGSETQDLLRDRGTEAEYLHRQVDGFADTERELIARADWRAEQLDSTNEKVAWLEEQVEGLRRENEWLRETVDGLEASQQALEAERDWRIEEAERAAARAAELEGVEAELRALREVLTRREEQLEHERDAHQQTELERAWRADQMEQVVARLVWRKRGAFPARLALHRELRRWTGGEESENGSAAEGAQ